MPTSENSLRCENCEIEISPVEITCENCGFPLAGTQTEKSVFIGQQIAHKSTIKDAGKFQKRSSYMLYAIGGFQLISGFSNYSQFNDLTVLIVLGSIGLIFIAFGFFASRKPLLFISLGLGLILFLYITDFIFDPASIFRGILWKVAIVGTLGYSLVNSYEEFKIKKKNKTL